MHFNYQHMEDFGYEILGLKFCSKGSLLNYVKYFPEHNSMVVFSTIHNNRVMVYRLTEEQYKDFQDGKYALSHNGNGHGTTPTGHPVQNYGYINVFSGGELKNRKQLKVYLDKAEEIAKSKTPVRQVAELVK